MRVDLRMFGGGGSASDKSSAGGGAAAYADQLYAERNRDAARTAFDEEYQSLKDAAKRQGDYYDVQEFIIVTVDGKVAEKVTYQNIREVLTRIGATKRSQIAYIQTRMVGRDGNVTDVSDSLGFQTTTGAGSDVFSSGKLSTYTREVISLFTKGKK